MTNSIKIDGEELNLDTLSENGTKILQLLQFSSAKIDELNNVLALLRKAKKGYIDTLKKEMISQKAGYLLDDI
jgi:hypothetical protein